MAQHNELGKKGEDAAVVFLKQQGYEIVDRNWRHDKYEIDIIARNEEFIIFVEVKTRTSQNWGNPEDAVSKVKMRRIVEAADFYLNEFGIDLPTRFDVIAIVSKNGELKIEHFDDAFIPSIY